MSEQCFLCEEPLPEEHEPWLNIQIDSGKIREISQGVCFPCLGKWRDALVKKEDGSIDLTNGPIIILNTH